MNGGGTRINPSLSCLPLEVKLLILSHLDNDDLKAVFGIDKKLRSAVDVVRWAHVVLDVSTAYKGRSTDNSYVARHIGEEYRADHSPAQTYIRMGRPVKSENGNKKPSASSSYVGSSPTHATDDGFKKERNWTSADDFVKKSVLSSNTAAKGPFDDLFSLVRKFSLKIPLYTEEYEGNPDFYPTRRVNMNKASLNIYWFLTKRVPERFPNLIALNFEFIANSLYGDEDRNSIFNSMMQTYEESIRLDRMTVSVNFEITRKSRLNIVTPLRIDCVKNLRIFYHAGPSVPSKHKHKGSAPTTVSDVERTIHQMVGGGSRLPESVERFEMMLQLNGVCSQLSRSFVKELVSHSKKLKHLAILGIPISDHNSSAENNNDSSSGGDNDNNDMLLPESIQTLILDNMPSSKSPVPNVTTFYWFSSSLLRHSAYQMLPGLKHLVLLGFPMFDILRLPKNLESLKVIKSDNNHQEIIRKALQYKVPQLLIYQPIHFAMKSRRFKQIDSDHKFDLLQFAIDIRSCDYRSCLEIEEVRSMTKCLQLGLNNEGYEAMKKCSAKLTPVGPVRIPCPVVDFSLDTRGTSNWVNVFSSFDLYRLEEGALKVIEPPPIINGDAQCEVMMASTTTSTAPAASSSSSSTTSSSSTPLSNLIINGIPQHIPAPYFPYNASYRY